MNLSLAPFRAIERLGTIEEVIGLKMVANGPPNSFIGELCELLNPQGQNIGLAEVAGLSATVRD